jgi:hypothetical protein
MEKPITQMTLKNKTKKKLTMYEHFSTMLQQFVKTNVLPINMDAQIGCFIDKL